MPYYQVWVKKTVSVKDWENKYSTNKAYCFLNQTPRGIEMGFLIGHRESELNDSLPPNLQPLTYAEKEQVAHYRKNAQMFPLPIEEGDNDPLTGRTIAEEKKKELMKIF